MWGSTYQSHLSKLVILKRKIVRIIHGVPSRTHTEPLFSELNILKVSNWYKYSIALFMYKLNYSKLPDIFPLFVHNYEVHNYETRQLKHSHLPPCRTNLSKMSIKYQGPIICNETSQGHDHLDIVIYGIHIEQVLSMKYLGTYINDWLYRDAQCDKLCPRIPGKIAVLSRIGPFCRSNKFELLYENAKK